MKEKKMKMVNVPNLRFSEFRDEWSEKKLGEIAEISRGKSKHRPRDAAFLYGGKYPFVQTGDIKNAGLFLETYSQTYSEEGLKQSKLWNENTLCITIAANIAETAILKIKACFPDSIIGLIPRNNQSNVIFIKYQFDNFKSEVQKLSEGIAQANLNQEKLSNISFAFPSLSEQTKIANFLSLLDERISTQSQIIDNLQSLIKTTCKVYHNSVEKTEYKIADLGSSFRVMNLSKEDLSVEGEKCILYGELFTTYDCVIDEIVSFTECNSSQKSLSGENDLLFPASTTVDSLSLISPSAISIKNVILGGDMFGIHLNKNFNNEYVSYVINYVYKIEFAKYAQGSTIIHLYYNDIKNIKIMLPNLDIQNFLADLMRLLRNKIQNEQKLLSAYQKQKAYLLQQIFI